MYAALKSSSLVTESQSTSSDNICLSPLRASLFIFRGLINVIALYLSAHVVLGIETTVIWSDILVFIISAFISVSSDQLLLLLF